VYAEDPAGMEEEGMQTESIDDIINEILAEDDDTEERRRKRKNCMKCKWVQSL
jgi:hypothetical protein